jgi:hypothetical protein
MDAAAKESCTFRQPLFRSRSHSIGIYFRWRAFLSRSVYRRDDDNTCSPIEDDLTRLWSTSLFDSHGFQRHGNSGSCNRTPSLSPTDRSSHRKTVGAATAFALIFSTPSKSCCHSKLAFVLLSKPSQTLRLLYTLQYSWHSWRIWRSTRNLSYLLIKVLHLAFYLYRWLHFIRRYLCTGPFKPLTNISQRTFGIGRYWFFFLGYSDLFIRASPKPSQAETLCS